MKKLGLRSPTGGVIHLGKHHSPSTAWAFGLYSQRRGERARERDRERVRMRERQRESENERERERERERRRDRERDRERQRETERETERLGNQALLRTYPGMTQPQPGCE